METAQKKMNGKKGATVADVAAAAGVSRTTVSYVLSGREDARVPETTRRRVADAAARIGYKRNALAAAFRSGRMDTVGIFGPLKRDEDPVGARGVYYRDLIIAVAEAAFEAGLNPLLLSENPSRHLSLADVADRRIDGVVMIIKENAEEFARAAADAGVPCVTIGRDVGQWQVHTDNILGARLAVEHLVSLGHRRIAHLWYGKLEIPSGRLRREGFRQAMTDADISENDAPIFTDRNPEIIARALTAPDAPTAVFCYNDELAQWLLDLAHGEKIAVPGKLSIVGFDDNVLAACTRPRLTTLRSPTSGVAQAAIALLQAQQSGQPAPPAPVLVPPRLVVRESSGPPSKEN